jgi:hypothetical protein
LIKQGIATAGKVEDSETIATALRWIDKRPAGDGFFLGMNLQNTHFSYVMPPDAVEPYQPSELGFRAVYYYWPAERTEQVRNRYLNAVYNVDRLLERFAAELKRRGLWDECLFVVLGDNGEAFYEHGFGNHSGPMYDEVVRTFGGDQAARVEQDPNRSVSRNRSVTSILPPVFPVLAGLPLPASFPGQARAPGRRNARRRYSCTAMRSCASTESSTGLGSCSSPSIRRSGRNCTSWTRIRPN